MRLLTWNVAGRVARQPEQAAAVAGVGADVVALQEVSPRTLPLWRDALAEAGYAACETGLVQVAAESKRGRLLGVLTAARGPLERLEPPAALPWPERVLRCRLGDVELLNVHSPIAPAPDLAKVRTHEAVAAHLAEAPGRARILCGDLNTPRRELPDGDVMTFAYDSAGRLRPERGERWDRAERALVHTLREHGWVDAFRALHGYGEREASWRFKDDRGGWRLDHVLVHGLRPVASAYAHDWRRAGLSDHSALVVELEHRVLLRPVADADLDALFEYQRDPESTRMAGLPARDREAFDAHWARIRADETVVLRAVIVDGGVAGSVLSFVQEGRRVVGYWIGREHWGRGIATEALSRFLGELEQRPLWARVARTNAASVRVLEKCGFTVIGDGRGADGVEDVILKLG